MNAISTVLVPAWTAKSLSALFDQLPAEKFDKHGLALTARAGLDVLNEIERVKPDADPKGRITGTIMSWSHIQIFAEYPETEAEADDGWLVGASLEREGALDNWADYVLRGVDTVPHPSGYLVSLAQRHGILLPTLGDTLADFSAAPPLRLLSLDDDDETPELSWTVDGIIQAHSLCAMVGAPGEGKTTLALSLALHIAAGQPFAGRDVLPGAVVYVAAEGHVGALKARVLAMKAEYGFEARLPVHLVNSAVNLLKPADVDGLITAISQIGAGQSVRAVIFDTLPQCMAGADENGAKDMGQAVASLARVRDATGAAIIALTHPARGGTAPRGSSALTGALDTQIGVTASRRGQVITSASITVAKQRNATAADTIVFDMTASSGALVPIYREGQTATATPPKPTLSEKARLALAFLEKNGPATDAVWRAAVSPLLTDSTDPASQRKAFNRVKEGLLTANTITQEDGIWCVATPPDGTK